MVGFLGVLSPLDGLDIDRSDRFIEPLFPCLIRCIAAAKLPPMDGRRSNLCKFADPSPS